MNATTSSNVRLHFRAQGARLVFCRVHFEEGMERKRSLLQRERG